MIGIANVWTAGFRIERREESDQERIWKSSRCDGRSIKICLAQSAIGLGAVSDGAQFEVNAD